MKIFIGHLFGHYDSRGGATLITGVDFKTACVRYIQDGFAVEEHEDYYQDMLEMVKNEEYLITTNVICHDESLLDGEFRDFVFEYNGIEHLIFAIVCKDKIHSWETYENGSSYCEYDSDDILEIHLGTKEQIGSTSEDHILAPMTCFGEDAFGVILQHYE